MVPRDYQQHQALYTSRLSSVSRCALGSDRLQTLILTVTSRYIHDAFVPWEYAPLVGKQQTFVVLDHHLYRCFDEKDKDKTGEDHARNLNIDMVALSKTCNGSIVVGEWSNGLDSSRRPENNSDQHKRAFCRAQLDMFEEHTAGWFFWTYKVHRWDYWNNKHQDSDSCWSAVTACDADIMPKWAGFKVKNAQVTGDGGQGHKLQAAFGKSLLPNAIAKMQRYSHLMN
jgi:glucan 1,3-beta-glucosidase